MPVRAVPVSLGISLFHFQLTKRVHNDPFRSKGDLQSVKKTSIKLLYLRKGTKSLCVFFCCGGGG